MSGQTKNRNTTSRKTQASSKAGQRNKVAEKRGMSVQSKAIILFASAILLACIVLIQGESLWLVMHNITYWFMGWLAILIPICLVYFAVMTAMEKPGVSGKFFMVGAIVVMLCTTVNLFAVDNLNSFADYFKGFSYITKASYPILGTGFLGSLLALPLKLMLGLLGARIVSIILLVALVMIFTGVTLVNVFNVAKKPVEKIKTVNYEHRIRAEQRRLQAQQYSENVNIDIPLEGEQRKRDTLSKADRLKKAVADVNGRPLPEAPVPGDFPSEEYIKQAQVMADASENVENIDNISDAAKEKEESDAIDEKSVPIDIYKAPKTVKVRKSKTSETEEYSREIGEEVRLSEQARSDDDGKLYKFPPASLLFPPQESDDTGVMSELQENGKKLIETLASFNVKAKIVNICRGPSVTRYEIQPAPGVKISKITNLSDDIALNLAAVGVRIEAPIPGKAAVGIEIPNKTVSMVSMRELIDSDEFNTGKSKLSCVLGRDISGKIITIDLAKLPHLLIAGTTGSGKSVCVNSILLSILFKATPDEVKLILIDPKMVEFSKYKSIPHLLIPVVSDPKKAAGALNWAVNEMLERYKAFSECGARDIHGYNMLVEENLRKMDEASKNGETLDLLPSKRFEQIVIAIDELSDLMMAAPKEVEDSIFRLAQMARAAGMHLVIATQRPSVDVITGVIKANIPSRIALKVSSQTDSRTILDSGGADKLIGKGDMLVMPVGLSKPIRVQGGYASDQEIENITDFVKKQSSAEYNEDVIEMIDQITETTLGSDKKGADSSADLSSDSDPLTEEAIKCVVEAGEASVSLLQRKLKVGYARAGRLVDDLESMGIVGPHEGSKKRKVLMSYQQWLERSGMGE